MIYVGINILDQPINSFAYKIIVHCPHKTRQRKLSSGTKKRYLEVNRAEARAPEQFVNKKHPRRIILLCQRVRRPFNVTHAINSSIGMSEIYKAKRLQDTFVTSITKILKKDIPHLFMLYMK